MAHSRKSPAKTSKTKKTKPEAETVIVGDDDSFEFDEQSEETQSASVALITKVDSVELPAAWGQSLTSIDEVRKSRQMMNLKHGMFANVPMVCKGKDCPLSEICTIPLASRPKSQRCPIEIGAIIELYDRYTTKLNIQSDDYFDQSQVKDLVDTEVKLLRANGRLAISADFIEMVVAGIDSNGDAHHRPELHKATDYERELLARKRQILGDLMATRKSKKEDKQLSDPSSFAASLMHKAMQAMNRSGSVIIDVNNNDDESDNYEEGE